MSLGVPAAMLCLQFSAARAIVASGFSSLQHRTLPLPIVATFNTLSLREVSFRDFLLIKQTKAISTSSTQRFMCAAFD
jgi:hypothetical protein